MRFEVQVRYSECDMQQVVHNSVYLRWCDDLADGWFRQVSESAGGPGLGASGWDVMVKASEITWTSPARNRDVVAIDVEATRFGTTSFDVSYVGHVVAPDGERPSFEATMTYVSVATGTLDTVPTPDWFRTACGH